jgi:hypothetical protein
MGSGSSSSDTHVDHDEVTVLALISLSLLAERRRTQNQRHFAAPRINLFYQMNWNHKSCNQHTRVQYHFDLQATRERLGHTLELAIKKCGFREMARV